MSYVACTLSVFSVSINKYPVYTVNILLDYYHVEIYSNTLKVSRTMVLGLRCGKQKQYYKPSYHSIYLSVMPF